MIPPNSSLWCLSCNQRRCRALLCLTRLRRPSTRARSKSRASSDEFLVDAETSATDTDFFQARIPCEVLHDQPKVPASDPVENLVTGWLGESYCTYCVAVALTESDPNAPARGKILLGLCMLCR